MSSIKENATSNFSNVSISNVYSILHHSNKGYGGALYLAPDVDHTITISNCQFENITSRIRGGALMIENIGGAFTLTLSDSTFKEVMGFNGGIIFGEFLTKSAT